MTNTSNESPESLVPGSKLVTQADTASAAKVLGQAIEQVQRVIVGQEHMVEQLMVALLAKGHCLLEGVPGVAARPGVRELPAR